MTFYIKKINNMWWNIFKFELKYRFKRPATYIYFGVLFLMSFLAMTTDVVIIGGAAGQVKINSPFTINQMMLIVSVFFFLITSAIMGVPVLRDFEHQTESIMFVNPIKKGDYLFGRFFGSFVTVVFVFSGMLFGFVIGNFMPWLDEARMLPFSFMNYIQPFFVFVLSNLFISSVIFFAAGTLSRKMMVVHTQGIFLLVLYIIGEIITDSLDNKNIAALLDPFSLNAITVYTKYWTIADKNTLLIPLSGVILYNRLIWTTVAVIGYYLTYKFFSFTVVRKPIKLLKKKNEEKGKSLINIALPNIFPAFNLFSELKKILTGSVFYARMISREMAFIAISIFGFALLFINGFEYGSIYGTQVYPTTYIMLSLIETFNLFFMIIVVYYTGDLVWKERGIKINQIHDSSPIKDISILTSKFLGIIWIYLILIVLLIFSGMFFQVINGYYKFELGLYFETLLTETLAFLLLFTFLGFLIQILVNHKFLGYALFIVFIIGIDVLAILGFEHKLIEYGMYGLGKFSDMNKYGHYFAPFSWFNLYWFGLAMVFFVLSILFSVRGTDTLMKYRLKIGGIRLNRQLMIFGITSFLVFSMSGCYIFYNTNIINEYADSDDEEERAVNYEKQLKKYEELVQPKITDTKVQVDIYPETRDFEVEGYYIMKNKSSEPISQIHVSLNPDHQQTYEYLRFDKEAKIIETYDDFRYYVYELEKPLQPGDSVKLSFKTAFVTKGFVEGNSNVDIVYNGTFFNNMYFPAFGYNRDRELGDENKRRDHDLPPKERMLARDSKIGKTINLLGDDADAINLDITLSTSKDQIAIAPGYIQKEWEENGRKYYHYKMDKPIWNFYSIVSARYAVMKDKWNDVNLEIYYHPEHTYNLESMMHSMKESLKYYSENYSPFQYRQLRILEFPRYRTFAQSFANTIPFSEGIGFIQKVEEDDDLNMSFYVTAHEIGHQWWAHQVLEARVKGNAMVSEALAQYSALMVMKHNYPTEYMKKFLKYELDKYLKGRSKEVKKEMTLEFVEQQGYIHYNKGSLIMFALQDYISEDSVNVALRRFIKDWAYSDGIYPTSADLLSYYEAVTPDSLKYILDDMFRKITLYENKTNKVVVEKADDKYEVIMDFTSDKIQADSLGFESSVKINDWINVGVYTENVEGKDSLIYYQKHLIKQKDNVISVMVDKKPTKAGIDPLNILIDKHPDDNVKDVELES
jgi:ABC-2 type transport system permease protein